MKESCTLSDKIETICELLSRMVSFGPQFGYGLKGVFFFFFFFFLKKKRIKEKKIYVFVREHLGS